MPDTEKWCNMCNEGRNLKKFKIPATDPGLGGGH